MNKSWLPISSPITLSLCFLNFDWPGFACLLNLFVVEVFVNRLPSGSWRCFTSFRWKCLGKSNIVGTEFGFVDPETSFKVFRAYSSSLSCSLIPGAYCVFFIIWWKTMKTNTYNFGLFVWVLFLCLVVGTVEGTAVMVRRFHAKSKKSLHKHRTSL